MSPGTAQREPAPLGDVTLPLCKQRTQKASRIMHHRHHRRPEQVLRNGTDAVTRLQTSTVCDSPCLVGDGAVPDNYLDHFRSLSDVITSASERTTAKPQVWQACRRAVWLHEHGKRKATEERIEMTAADPIVVAASGPPQKFTARFQQGLCAGPDAIADVVAAAGKPATTWWLQTCFDFAIPCPGSEEAP